MMMIGSRLGCVYSVALFVVIVSEPTPAEIDVDLQCSGLESQPKPEAASQAASLLQWRSDMPAPAALKGRRSCRFREEPPQDDEEPPAQEVFGDQVPLDEEGFKLVMDFPCGYEKELFISRLVKEMGMTVKNDKMLHDLIPVITKEHEDPSFDLEALRARIRDASKEVDSWVGKPKAPSISLHTRKPTARKHKSISLMAISGEVRRRKSKVLNWEMEGSESGSKESPGAAAPISEAGYRAVARLKSDKQMDLFVRRAIDSYNLHILDEGALHGLVPYYSGAKAVQSLHALEKDFTKAKSKPNAWLVPKASEEREMQNDSLLRKTSKHTSPLHRRREKGSFVQTESHSESTSSSSYLRYLTSWVQEQAVYFVGARVTAVACIGSLLFGLYLFDESTHYARQAKLGEMPSTENVKMPMGKDAPLVSTLGEPVRQSSQSDL